MLWIDVATPKYALFFSQLIPEFKAHGYDVLVTTRYAPDYTEAKAILEAHGVSCVVSGGYGGNSVAEKFRARLNRQNEFVRIFEERGRPQALLCGSVPDSIQTAFGLGVPVINFCDTPIRGHEFADRDITMVTRLTLSLSDLVFYPFVLPAEIFLKMGVAPDRLREYDFIDVCLWMDAITPGPAGDFSKKYGLDPGRMTVLVREEEYKAHYVKVKLPLIYQVIPRLGSELNANVVIMPRYGADEIRREFSAHALVLEEKLKPEEFYPYIDLLIGGGGTMNLEAVYYGIPTISTRSLKLYHDKYLIDHDLMWWADSVQGVLDLAKKWIGKKSDNKKYFMKETPSAKKLVHEIHGYLQCVA